MRAAGEALRYMVFDLPQHPGGFAQRQQALQRVVKAMGQPWVQAAAQWQVDSHAALQQQLNDVSAAGAEGLMLRRADGPTAQGAVMI